MSKVIFTMIGSGAVRVNVDRAGPSQLLQTEGNLMLFDCGRCAVHNIERFGYKVHEIGQVFLTHLHFDHVCDLAYFMLLSWNNGRKTPLQIYGPPGLEHFLQHALWKAYEQDIFSRTGHGKSLNGLTCEVNEIADGEIAFESGEIRVASMRTEHGGIDNFNYRLDTPADRVVITSDTQYSDRLVSFCRDATLLVCECSGTKAFLAQKPWGHWHMTPETVAELASRSGVKKVVIKHLVIEDFYKEPGIAEKMAGTISERFNGRVMVGMDGMQIVLE